MSPELQAILDAEAAKQQAASDSLAHAARNHNMAYRTSKSALAATTTFYRPRQL